MSDGARTDIHWLLRQLASKSGKTAIYLVGCSSGTFISTNSLRAFARPSSELTPHLRLHIFSTRKCCLTYKPLLSVAAAAEADDSEERGPGITKLRNPCIGSYCHIL